MLEKMHLCLIKHIFGNLDQDLVSVFNVAKTQQFLLTIEGSLTNDSHVLVIINTNLQGRSSLSLLWFVIRKNRANSMHFSDTKSRSHQEDENSTFSKSCLGTSYNYLQRYKLQSTGWVFVSAWASKEIHLSGYCWILISGWHSICLVSGEVSDCGRCLLLLLPPRPPIPILCRD